LHATTNFKNSSADERIMHGMSGMTVCNAKNGMSFGISVDDCRYLKHFRILASGNFVGN